VTNPDEQPETMQQEQIRKLRAELTVLRKVNEGNCKSRHMSSLRNK